MYNKKKKKRNTPSQNVFCRNFLQNVKKTCKNEDFWFKMSLSKFLHSSYIILVIVKLHGPNST